MAKSKSKSQSKEADAPAPDKAKVKASKPARKDVVPCEVPVWRKRSFSDVLTGKVGDFISRTIVRFYS